MKKKLQILLAVIAISTFAHAQLTDREEILDTGIYGILHTENFEYVCEMTEGSDNAVIKSYLDLDLDEKNNPRFAIGFAGGARLFGKYIAAEAKVSDYKRARTPALNLTFTLQGSEGKTMAITFSQDTDLATGEPTGPVKMSSVAPDGTTTQVDCAANEVH